MFFTMFSGKRSSPNERLEWMECAIVRKDVPVQTFQKTRFGLFSGLSDKRKIVDESLEETICKLQKRSWSWN